MRVGFGGGCHWCTEAVYEALEGVLAVKQGWIASYLPGAREFSEAVLVEFDETKIEIEALFYIHLLTHNATSSHSMRGRYRSAIYAEDPQAVTAFEELLQRLQVYFDKPLVTKVYPILAFKENKEESLHYYLQDPNRPFCQTHIAPKLRKLKEAGFTLKPLFSQLADRSAK